MTRVRARQKATERGLKDPLAETHRQSRGLARKICKKHLVGKCTLPDDQCPRRHNKLCLFFRAKGGCKNGKDCQYPHVQTTRRRLVRRSRHLAKSQSPQKIKRRKDQDEIAAAGGIVRRRPRKGRPLSSSPPGWWPSAVVFASIQSRQRFPSMSKGEIYLIPCGRSCEK